MIKLPDAKETKFVYHGGNGAFDCGYESGWNAAIAEVQRLNATAHPVSDGWVKCSERMPLEKSGKMDEIVVLVTDGNSVGMAACYSGDLPKPWVSFTSYGDVHGTDITHWMPLPAVPGGQDD